MEIRTVTTAGLSMDYFCFGSGEKILVILPGLSIQSVMGSADLIAQSYQDFAADYTIYVFDRRKDMPESYPVHEMARDTAQAMLALGLKDCYLFGASQGGMMALVIAIEYPELVRKMVLGSTSAHVLDSQYTKLLGWAALAKAGDRKGLYLAFGKEIYPPEVYEQYRDTLISAAETVTEEDLARFLVLVKGTEGFDVTKDLQRIQCPVMAIGVYEDAVLDSDATMEIAQALDARSDFKLYMYIGYGHAAFDTAPDYHARMLKFFGE